MSIGAVLEQLRPDFPEVTISKIRFLESEGLIRPARTDSGYRQFASDDIERLRFVLQSQRDHYLPLKVIKEQLDAGGPGADPGAPGHEAGDAAVSGGGLAEVRVVRSSVSPADDEASSAVQLDRAVFLAETGLTDPELRDLEQYGLLRAADNGCYDAELVGVARTAVAMMAYGIEPRHLRAFRTAADREVGLLAQLVTPVARQRGVGARAKADAMGRELAGLSVALHTMLVKVGLRDAIGS